MPDPDLRPDVARIAYSPAEAAAALGVSRQHVHELLRRGQLRSVKLGRSRRIPASALAELLDPSAEVTP